MSMGAPATTTVLPSRFSGIRRILASQEVVLFLVIVVLFVIVGLINPRFIAERNLSSIFLGNAYIAVAAIGMTMVIITGNIDISVGSLIGVLATVSGTLALSGLPVIIAWVVPIFLGMLITAGMGALVAYLRIPSIVVTLGMLSILKGGLISVTQGVWLTDLPPEFFLAQKKLLNLPSPIWFMIVLTIAAAIWMRMSATGRSIYAVGGNAEAARLSGISSTATVMKAFIIHGFFVGIASVLFATQLSVIQSTVPAGLELLIITASVVGGVSIMGGTGTVIGSTLAAVLLAEIAAAMIFVGMSPFWMRAVQGLLILITVLADLWRRQRQRTRG
jgi:ribose/xylose/arabinose/galactoside ABC-type transport system permease subunit